MSTYFFAQVAAKKHTVINFVVNMAVPIAIRKDRNITNCSDNSVFMTVFMSANIMIKSIFDGFRFQ